MRGMAQLPERYRGVLIQEGVLTEDHRMIAEGALDLKMRSLPLPLMFMPTASHGWDSWAEASHLSGTIEELTRNGADIEFGGAFDLGGEWGAEAARQVDAGVMRWVSADAIATEWEFVDNCEDPYDWSCTDWYEVVVKGGILGGTLVPMPAFGEATVEAVTASVLAGRHERRWAPGIIVPEGPQADSLLAAAVDEWRGAFHPVPSLVACSCTDTPPGEWFARPPELDDPDYDGRIVVTDAGRTYGLVAPFGVCHTGVANKCTMAPRSKANYAYFRTGTIRTADGTLVPVGQVTMGAGHADTSLSHRSAVAHYDDTCAAVADVAVGEDDRQVWFAGALRPGTTAEQVRALRASSLSGDWRSIGGNLELVAALCVNSPGFPPVSTTATMRASAEGEPEQVSLIAAGVRPPDQGRDARWVRATTDRLLRMEARLAQHDRFLTDAISTEADRLLQKIRETP